WPPIEQPELLAGPTAYAIATSPQYARPIATAHAALLGTRERIAQSLCARASAGSAAGGAVVYDAARRPARRRQRAQYSASGLDGSSGTTPRTVGRAH